MAILSCVLLSSSCACAHRNELLLTPGHPDKYITCKIRACLSFTECITAPSRCFNSSTTVWLLPVQYNLTAPVVIRDVQQLSFRGDNNREAHCSGHSTGDPLRRSWFKTDLSRSELGSNGYCGEYLKATIRCNGEAGFLFINATFLCIADVHFDSCGFDINTTQLVSETHHQQRFLTNSFTAGLQLMLTFHAVINRVEISNSTGNGIFWINPFDSYLVNSIINSTNYYRMKEQLDGAINCTKISSRCMGGNIWILFVDTECPSMATATKFIIQNTEVLYGINLQNQIWGQRYAGGLGVSLTQTGFDVQVHIWDSRIHHNVADAGANAYFRIMYFVSNSTIDVFNTSLSYGNRPFTDPHFMGYYDQAAGAYIDIDSMDVFKTGNQSSLNVCINHTTDTTNTRVVLDEVWMMHNRGGALKIFVTEAGQPCCFHVLVTNTVIDGTQVYYYDADVLVSIALFIQEERAETNPSLNVSLLRVQISNSYIEYGEKGKAELKNFPKITTLLFSDTSSVQIHNSTIDSNNATGILALSSKIHFIGENTISNNSGVLGGALSMDGNSIMILHPDSLLVLSENVAEYGGGIIINAGVVKQYPALCFYQLIPKVQSNILSSGAQVILENNSANQAGHSLYGGNYGPHSLIPVCNQLYQNLIHPSQRIPEWEVFNATFQIQGVKRDSELSSVALGLCFCIKQKCNASVREVNLLLFPGQQFRVAATGLGCSNGTTNAFITPTLENLSTHGNFGPHVMINNKPQHVETTCKHLSFKLTAPENATNIGVRLVAEGSTFYYSFSRVVNITTKFCPVGFQLLNHSCACLPALRKLGVECNIDNQSFSRRGSLWTSITHHNVLYHKQCPPEYCDFSLVHFRANDSDALCGDDHTGILCGGCKEGFSIALGSSKCLQCTNAYLGLTVVFLLAGILLIVFLAVLNMTVATGTINGLVFYANIVQASQGSFGVAPYGNKVASVFIAWLNLDFGIQTCFYNGLDVFMKTLLQFAFPVYIWVIAACIVVSSHYSSLMGRLSGTNIVPVLATLFLLSYTKILRAVIVTFSFTLIYREDGTSYAVWLYNGNLQFLHGKHLFLFACSIVFTLLFILPLMLLTLFAPCLQRARYWRIQILAMKLKPLLDAYQGPYKDRYRFWTGVMLLLQTLLLIGFAMNESDDPAIVLLVVILAGSLVMFISLVGHGGKYKRVLVTGLQCFYVYNLVLFASWSLYNQYTYKDETELFNQQRVAVDTTTGMTALVFVITVIYHICNRRRIKDWILRTCRKLQAVVMGNQEDEQGDTAVFTTETETSPLLPTFSVVSIYRTDTTLRSTH